MLTVNNITKKYSNGRGIFDISFEIKEPKITAVIGPNGSGKSTLFQIIAGLSRSDKGEVLFNEQEINHLEAGIISFMPESSWLIPSFTVRQMLMYFNVMKTNKDNRDNIDRLIKLLDIEKYQHQHISSLSQGMKQKVAAVCAFVGNPKLIIFDEPLNYLDIESVISFKKLLRYYSQRGTYILISSHILDFLDNVAQKTIFLHNGQIEEICDNIGSQTLEEKYKSIFLGRT